MIKYIFYHAYEQKKAGPGALDPQSVLSHGAESIYLTPNMKRTSGTQTEQNICLQPHIIRSKALNRDVKVDFYQPREIWSGDTLSLLLLNDGQDMSTMGFQSILETLYATRLIDPVLFVAIHAGKDRKNEYGTASTRDYKGRGAKAAAYSQFVMDELLPFVRKESGIATFRDKSFCGFSLGGLMALDIVWNHPHEFRYAAVFSGSLWWRTRGLHEGYSEEKHRIMPLMIRQGNYAPWLKFFFQTGLLDETSDRNHNGIIDSIDDTLAVIEELKCKGYHPSRDIKYLELIDGRHDVPTWGRAMPSFLKWAYGLSS